ncbi:hypothetical protein [Streptomyces sp. NPDC005374]|uniref:hypothetical protein n=1 Tax=Streptomyces sp. NPDC005374 TaxID=3364713 RepID=UPI00369F7C3A
MTYIADNIVCCTPGGPIEGAEGYRAFMSLLVQILASAELIAALGVDEKATLVYDTRTVPVESSPAAECVTVTNAKIVANLLPLRPAAIRNPAVHKKHGSHFRRNRTATSCTPPRLGIQCSNARHLRIQGCAMATSEIITSLPLQILIGGRIFAAATHLFAPRWAARLIRMDATGTPAITYARMFAIRNAILAAGLLHLESFTEPSTFVALNVLVDSVDAVAFLAAGLRKDISARSAALGAGISLFAVAAGTAALLIDPAL